MSWHLITKAHYLADFLLHSKSFLFFCFFGVSVSRSFSKHFHNLTCIFEDVLRLFVLYNNFQLPLVKKQRNRRQMRIIKAALSTVRHVNMRTTLTSRQSKQCLYKWDRFTKYITHKYITHKFIIAFGLQNARISHFGHFHIAELSSPVVAIRQDQTKPHRASDKTLHKTTLSAAVQWKVGKKQKLSFCSIQFELFRRSVLRLGGRLIRLKALMSLVN